MYASLAVSLSPSSGSALVLLWLVGCSTQPGCSRPSPTAEKPRPTQQDEPEPAPEPAGDRAVQIETNGLHFCARLESGRVACWGRNEKGQLGDGTTLPSDTLVLVEGLEDAEDLFDSGLCARTSEHDAFCWSEPPPSRCTPVPGTVLCRLDDVVAGSRELDGDGCFASAQGRVLCDESLPESLGDWAAMRRVHQGQSFVCGETEDSRISCFWKADGPPGKSLDPPLPSSEAFAVGSFHICASDSEGRVHCWGDARRSGFAADAPERAPDPYTTAYVLDDLEAKLLAAGEGHTCALTDAARVHCWGRKSYASKDRGEYRSWNIDLADQVEDLAVGRDIACAVVRSGGVHCWPLTESGGASRVPGLPLIQEPESAPPRRTAEQLRAALEWATDARRLRQIASLENGLIVGRVREGRWQQERKACFAEHLESLELSERVEGRWTCDTRLERCVAQRDSDASVFRWEAIPSGERKLVAVVYYDDGAVPEREPLPVERHLAERDPSCALWRALAGYDETLVADSITVMHHPANALGDEPPPVVQHYCGAEARRMARTYLGVDLHAEDWRCDDLVCSYNLGQGARGVFVFRRDDAGQPKLWIVGDDVDPSIQPEAKPTLPEAIRGAKRHECAD